MFFGSDFITVTKNDGDWQQLKPAILGAIMEHFMSGAPIVDGRRCDAAADSDEFFDAADAETVATIKDLIETRVRPAVANDGGDITFRGFKDGIVYLAMKGACSGCPSSTATLQHGIQNLLQHFVPDVVEVRPVSDRAPIRACGPRTSPAGSLGISLSARFQVTLTATTVPPLAGTGKSGQVGRSLLEHDLSSRPPGSSPGRFSDHLRRDGSAE